MGKYKIQIGCAVLLAILIGGIYRFHRFNQDTRNSYAVWWVADLVVDHMKANDGQWPSGWDDLRNDYQACVDRSGQPWSFAELSQQVIVDWQADPQQLLDDSNGADTAEFKVITLSDGTEKYWQHREPNQIILDYLRSTKRPANPFVAAGFRKLLSHRFCAEDDDCTLASASLEKTIKLWKSPVK